MWAHTLMLLIFFFYHLCGGFFYTLLSKSLIQSPASSNLLFIPFTVFLVLVFIFDWLFFMFSVIFHVVVVLSKFSEHLYNHYYEIYI